MKSVYTGGEKVGEFESYDELRVGDGKPAFIYEGNELVYPNPVKDGLVLWYDFSGRTNADGQRGVAEDFSGNGNHGTLQNFNYTAESGYDKNKLLFDGVDDRIRSDKPFPSSQVLSAEIVITGREGGYSGVIKGGYGVWALNEWGIRDVGSYHSFYYSNGDFTSSITTPVQLNKITHFCFVMTETELIVYRNGKQIGLTERNAKNDMRFTEQRLEIGTAYSGAHGTHIYHSIKIYHRPLTPEEIAHNYAIEKERFGIE